MTEPCFMISLKVPGGGGAPCLYLIIVARHFALTSTLEWMSSHSGFMRVTFGSLLIEISVPVLSSSSHLPSLMNQIWL